MHVFVGQYPFHQEIVLKYELFLDDVIQIRFRKIITDNDPMERPSPSVPKKKKVKERTIQEAVQAVN